jgi:hypothetical protein
MDLQTTHRLFAPCALLFLLIILQACSAGQVESTRSLSPDVSGMDWNYDQGVQQFSLAEELALNGAFYPQPGACSSYYSKEYYCDGYTQLNLPLGSGSPNVTPEIATSTAPASYFNGMQILGPFDASRPSVIYIHGWNVEAPDHVFGLPDQWVKQMQAAGYNTLQFHWAELAYDDGGGCPGLGWFGVGNIPCNVSHELYKGGSAIDIFLNAYKQIFSDTQAPVRLVSQSLGATLTIYAAYRMYIDDNYSQVNKPNRIDLIDPFIGVGMGGDRSRPYDGQVPPDSTLPGVYRNHIVTDFVAGSPCHANWRFFIPPNHLSQYCQAEGMLYHLLKDYDVGAIVFSSIVGGASAGDFDRVAVFQAFSGSAFQGDLTSRHTSPNASYFFSFAPGEPNNAYDASTPDEGILNAARQQALDGVDMSLIQTAGYDTISLLDDNYQPR